MAAWCWSRAAGRPGAGLTGAETVALVEGLGRTATLRPLPEAAYWGREITDERYAVTA